MDSYNRPSDLNHIKFTLLQFVVSERSKDMMPSALFRTQATAMVAQQYIT